MEYFDCVVEWTRAAVQEGGCAIRVCGHMLWAENWEGQSCGEWYPDKQEGYLNFA